MTAGERSRVNLTEFPIYTTFLTDEDIVMDVLVLMRVQGPSAEPRVIQCATEGSDWMLLRGMLEIARDGMRAHPSEWEDDEEG